MKVSGFRQKFHVTVFRRCLLAQTLKRFFGHEDFRDGQAEAIHGILQGKAGPLAGRFDSFDGRKEVVGTEFGRISVEDVFFHGNGLSSDVLSLGESCNHNVFWKVVRMPWWSWPPAPENH